MFAYVIDWKTVESAKIVEDKMRPWVVKKMVEILGEEEPTLTEYDFPPFPRFYMETCLYFL